MNKPKFSIGQEVYTLHSQGISKKKVVGIHYEESLDIFSYYFEYHIELTEQYIFSTLCELKDFLAKEFEKFAEKKELSIHRISADLFGMDGSHIRLKGNKKGDDWEPVKTNSTAPNKSLETSKPRRGRKPGSKDSKPRKRRVKK